MNFYIFSFFQDTNGPTEGGRIIPATGAFISAIELATGRKAYFVGKPNPLMSIFLGYFWGNLL
jgi:ribonucleotide monophosphatase NagD (HAD superfamily)